MSAVEEHKPVEKRRALGRGLDSLLPSGPRMVPAAPTSAAGAATARTGMSEPHGAAAVRPPVIPAAVPEIVPPTSSAVTGEIAEIHAGREKTPTRAEAPAGPADGCCGRCARSTRDDRSTAPRRPDGVGGTLVIAPHSLLSGFVCRCAASLSATTNNELASNPSTVHPMNGYPRASASGLLLSAT